MKQGVAWANDSPQRVPRAPNCLMRSCTETDGCDEGEALTIPAARPVGMEVCVCTCRCIEDMPRLNVAGLSSGVILSISPRRLVGWLARAIGTSREPARLFAPPTGLACAAVPGRKYCWFGEGSTCVRGGAP